MASAPTGRGRGRGRGTASSTTAPPAPSITPTTDVSITTSPIAVNPQPTSSTPVFSDSGSTAAAPIDTSVADTGFSSGSSEVQSSPAPASTVPKGRGRGGPAPKKVIVPEDPHWMVTNLTQTEFYSTQRPKKPDELGTLGQQIQVLANYFPILQFPNKGLVYKYQIQIRNRKHLEIHRERRRVLYNSWLQGLYRRFPEMEKYKIVFDNQSRILTFDQKLPDIYETETSEQIMGPNRSNKQEPHTVIVQRVGTPVDLALIQNLGLLFDPNNQSNERRENLEDVKQVLSIALHEHCSSHATFVYNRTFYSLTADGRHGEWDLGNGKALWRGFYSCLVFGKGKHQLLMNIDGLYQN